MKYIIAIETIQIVEAEADSEEAAIEIVKKQLDPRIAAAATLSVIKEAVLDEESNVYKVL